MKNIVLVCVVAFAFCTTAIAGDIAISTQAGWFGQAAADREMQEIADNVTAVPVEQFTADDQAALADWVVAHTGDGVSDLLILCGNFPDSIYPPGNAEPDGSLAELFLDDGNIIVNTGDYMFYVNSGGTNNNAAGGLQNMMDIANGAIDMWDDNTPVVVTAEGLDITPSLVDFQTDRPFHLDALEGAWYPELILAQNAAGTRADAVIVSNAETGGRLGIFYQTASQDDDPRGEVISEWINNWFLTAGDVPNPPASNPNPADGAVDADATALEWAAAFGAATYKVYLSTDATIDDADLIGETDLTLQVAVLDPGTSYYWRVDAIDADGIAVEGPVWSFSTLPLEAHFPSPADGATNAISVELSWTPGKNAIMHNVHYGTNAAVLLPVQMMSMETSYDPGALDPDTTYYWRVDEFTPAGTVTGPVWSFSTIGPVTPVPEEGLVARYPMDEDAISLAALDVSGNDYHGALQGDPQFVAGVDGGALDFDGIDDFIFTGKSASELGIGGNDPRTVTAWVFTRSFNNGGIFDVGNRSTGQDFCLRTLGTTNRWRIQYWGGDFDFDYDSLDKWVHFVHVHDGASTKIYADGALIVDWAKTIDTPDSNPFQIGVYGWQNDFFNGLIDDVRVYNRALTIEEARVMAGVEALPWSPEPANGAEGLSANAVLSWNAGEGAVEQDVYLGFDADAVAAADATDTTGIYRGRQAETTYTPLDLAFGTTHYWRVDQVDADGNAVVGPVWSFDVAVAVPMDNWTGAATAAGASYLDTFVRDDLYDIGIYGGEQTYEFIVLADPDETEASMALIGRRQFGDTQVGLKYEQWNNTGTYGATVFGVVDLDFGVANNPGVVTHLVFVSSEAAGTTELYIDGELAGSVDSAISMSGIVGIGYGAQGADMSGAFDNFDGDIFGVAIYDGALSAEEIAQNAEVFSLNPSDVTAPGDTVQGVPNDGDWPGGETPDLAIDDDTGTKFLHFKGETEPSGIQVEPAMGATVVTGLALTTANDAPERDPASFEISGSNDSIDGPYTLIASGDVVDFTQADAWPRFTRNATGMFFANDVAYKYYQVMFPTVRDAAGANSMQIAEVELLGVPSYIARWEFDGDYTGMGPAAQTGVPVGAVAIVDDPVRGQVVSLPGGDDQFVDLGGVGISGNMPKTVMCWAKALSTDIPNWTLIFGFTGQEDGSGGNGSHFNIGSLGGPGGVGAHCWGWEETIFSDTEALDWHHYAMTYDGTTIQYYGDGVLMDTDEAKSNVRDLSASADRVHVGSRITQASSFPGLVDDARIYAAALSAGQISKIVEATAAAAAPADGPVNLMFNGGLEDDVSGAGWSTYGDAAMEVVQELVGAAVPDAPIEGSSCLHVTVNTAGANFWDAGLQHGGKVFEAGKSYTLSVWFKSKSGPFQINIKPERAESPWDGFGSQEITITEEWAEYTVNTGVMAETVDPASITFHIAYAPGEFWVDNAVLSVD